MLAAMPSTAVWVDMTGSSPAAVRELATAARAHGVGVLDAPVGGDAAVLDRCRRVLEALADPQRIIRVGGNGAGYTAKLLVNLLWFGQAVATGEGLLLARRAGTDLDVLRQTVATSAASHRLRPRRPRRATRRRLPHVLRAGRCCEELTAIADLARELRVPSQLTQVVKQTYQRALRRFGPVDGELLAVALLEEGAGRVRPADADPLSVGCPHAS